jgi:hypothetical protein
VCLRIAPLTGTWVAGGTLNQPRWLHAAVRLADGRVLVAGGGRYTATAELYDPATNRWAPTGSMNVDRITFTATLLRDGRVLVVGRLSADGSGVQARAELYDPSHRPLDVDRQPPDAPPEPHGDAAGRRHHVGRGRFQRRRLAAKRRALRSRPRALDARRADDDRPRGCDRDLARQRPRTGGRRRQPERTLLRRTLRPGLGQVESDRQHDWLRRCGRAPSRRTRARGRFGKRRRLLARHRHLGRRPARWSTLASRAARPPCFPTGRSSTRAARGSTAASRTASTSPPPTPSRTPLASTTYGGV